MSDSNTGVRLLMVVLGFWLVMRSVNKDASGRTLIDHILGQAGGANQQLPGASDPLTGQQRASDSAVKGAVNPVPGATGNRLDQGFDVTSREFVAPYAGTVVASEAHDQGWRGGGYIAIQSATDPSKVEYFAEGLTPILAKGAKVTPGETIATPRQSPYPSGGFGTIETGPANPRNPLQPLAQVVKDPQIAVMSFYNWLRLLGAPAATSTSGAGHP